MGWQLNFLELVASLAVAVSIPEYLRIHRGPAEDESGGLEAKPDLDRLCRGFQRATGWTLRYVMSDEKNGQLDPLWSAPVNPGVGDSPGYLMIGAAEKGRHPRAKLSEARCLAESVAALVADSLQADNARWRHEASLAAAIPVAARPEDPVHLAARLESVLRGGAESIDCQAAGLYLLDAATTELKLRSCWGIPRSRLADPPRPLRGAIADLEALTGHAVVLSEKRLMESWAAPEDYPSALCVPVSSPTTILGTLWMLADSARDFSDQETNLAEIIAGRLAADLEREALLSEGVRSDGWKRQVDVAMKMQRDLLPQSVPVGDGWDVAGWTPSTDSLGGHFHDWFNPCSGRLGISVVDALEQGMDAGLCAMSVRTALRAHAAHSSQAGQVLTRTNETLWSGSVGDQFAAAFYALLDGDTGKICCAGAGQIGAMVIRPSRSNGLNSTGMPLGIQPETRYRQHRLTMARYETLLVTTDGVFDALSPEGEHLGEANLAESIMTAKHATAEETVGIVRQCVETHTGESAIDGTILVVRKV